MSRRIRLRQVPADELLELLVEAAVEAMLAPVGTYQYHEDRLRRIHTEWRRRHGQTAAEGCTCRGCVGNDQLL